MAILKLDFILDLACFIIYPLLVFFLILFWTYKQFVIAIANITQSRRLVPLSGCDSAAAVDDFNEQSDFKTSMRLNVGLVLRLNKNSSLNISWLRTKFENVFFKKNVPEPGIRPFANLYSYLITFGGYTFRKSVDTVNLEQQIREVTVPNTQSLQEYLANFFKAGYEKGTPFWKVLLLPAPDAEDEVIIVLKIHHSMADGYTLIHMLDMLTDSKTPYTVKEFENSIWNKAALVFRAPRMLLRFIRETSRMPQMFSLDKDEDQFFSFTTLNLADMKNIRRMTGSKFDSIYMSLLGGVVRRLHLENSNEDKLLKYNFISSAVPWPNHPCASGREGEMGNHWTLTGVQVPMYGSSLNRLRAVDENYKKHLEQEFNKITYRLVMPFLGVWPNVLKQMWAASSPVQVACSINMGSVKPYVLNQNEIKSVHIVAGCLHSNAAIMGLCFSNCNRLECIMAIRKSVARTQEMSDRICNEYLNEELQELLQHVNSTVVPETS